MKLHYRLWIVFSLFWIAGMIVLYSLIIQLFEERTLEYSSQLSRSEGHTILDRVIGLYPNFSERAEGYLDYYSSTFGVRLFLLNEEKRVLYDSFGELPENQPLSLEVLGQEAPTVYYMETDSFGYVQYTLLPLEHRTLSGTNYLVMVKDANAVQQDVASFRLRVLMYLGFAAVAGFFLFYIVASWFTRPIRQIMQHLKRITPQKREFTMTYDGHNEIGELVQEIRQMVKELDQYELRQRRFISASSHELKTPLATLQLIVENLPQIRNQALLHQEYLEDMQTQIEKMKQTIQGMLDVYRMAEKKLEIEKISIDQIEQHSKKSFQHLAESKQIHLSFEGAPSLGVPADRVLFFQGLDNLISNALHYSPKQSEIKVKVEKEGEYTVCSVTDQGYGIDEEDIPYLYEPFYRSRRASTWNPFGSGLGMAIVKQMMDLHQGTVRLQSQVGQGTTVELRFGNKTVTQRT
ncbi:sensor histidine kinase [Bacillus horti]|uniref:histidine kinase n=1 Tax=Caldalkalibacillus horti TaxID=77523 RepID=A0ABT9VZ25_9BACI|nr:HAMP domain-containing sensor histidine kinase [Bacillus horti]MDQ0166252.1 signal transduction histidine kinase [Bacillus horti]